MPTKGKMPSKDKMPTNHKMPTKDRLPTNDKMPDLPMPDQPDNDLSMPTEEIGIPHFETAADFAIA